MGARNYSDTAVPTRLTAGIAAGTAAFSVLDATGWPTTNFIVTLERGQIGEEKVLVGSRSGLACSSVTRGFGGTTAVAHLGNVAAEHTLSAVDLAEANALVQRAPAGAAALADVSTVQTFTNKTLTNPTINGGAVVGIVVDTTSTQTMSGKTLTSPTLNSPISYFGASAQADLHGDAAGNVYIGSNGGTSKRLIVDSSGPTMEGSARFAFGNGGVLDTFGAGQVRLYSSGTNVDLFLGATAPGPATLTLGHTGVTTLTGSLVQGSYVHSSGSHTVQLGERFIYVSGGTGVVFDATASAAAFSVVTVFNAGAAATTLTASGRIFYNSSSGTTITLAVGETIDLLCDGAGNWFVMRTNSAKSNEASSTYSPTIANATLVSANYKVTGKYCFIDLAFTPTSGSSWVVPLPGAVAAVRVTPLPVFAGAGGLGGAPNAASAATTNVNVNATSANTNTYHVSGQFETT